MNLQSCACSVQSQLLVPHSYLDDVPVNKVLAFESALISFLKSKYKSLMDNIESTKDLSGDDFKKKP